MAHILLVEDDPRIQGIVERGLGARGFEVTSAGNAAAGVELARTLEVDLVLLDLLLPDRPGLAALEEIRAAKPRLPVIALTALDDVGAKVGGLDAGADDYLTKPFSVDELAARVRARLRAAASLANGASAVKAGPLTVDVLTHRAVLHGRAVPLSARELALLTAFARHRGMVLSRAQLLDMVWGLDSDPGSNVVEVYVAALRRKIGARFLETVRGIGYRFVVPEPSPRAAVASGRPR
jgi:two-component system, OmpR family, copper resistance phosphate regulon response regulator CusR